MTKLAIIGCGKQAPKHINGLKQANPDIDLIVVDRNEVDAKALGEAQNLPWSTDITAIIEDPSIDAIDICTPTASHKRLISRAVNNNKDYFCEKPLCDSLDEAREIAEMTDAHNRIGMVGYVYRFTPVFKAAYDAIQQNALGDIVTAQFRIGGRGSHQVWKHRKETNGGALSEMMVHMLDLAIWYFGDVESTEVLVKELLRPQRKINGVLEDVDAEDYLIVRAKMKSGVEVLLQADMVTPAFSQSVEIQGDNGSFMGSIQPDRPSYLFLDQAVAGYEKGRTDLNNDGSNLFSAQMGEFLQSVQTRTQPERSNIQDSIKIMNAIEMIKAQGDFS